MSHPLVNAPISQNLKKAAVCNFPYLQQHKRSCGTPMSQVPMFASEILYVYHHIHIHLLYSKIRAQIIRTLTTLKNFPVSQVVRKLPRKPQTFSGVRPGSSFTPGTHPKKVRTNVIRFRKNTPKHA